MRGRLGRLSILRRSVLNRLRRGSTRVLSVACFALALAAVAAVGCGGAETREEEPVTVDDEIEAPREPFTLYKDEVERALERGLQPLIADVNLRPVHDGGRFLGWRLQFLKPGESPYRESAVRPGDVLVRVNEQPLERPDQMMAVWKSLEGTDHITFQVVRGGRPLDITYRVVERSSPDGSPSDRP